MGMNTGIVIITMLAGSMKQPRNITTICVAMIITTGGAGNVDATSMSPAIAPLLIGFLAAAICGYAAIRLLLSYLRRRPLYPFAIYCAIVGLLAILLI